MGAMPLSRFEKQSIAPMGRSYMMLGNAPVHRGVSGAVSTGEEHGQQQ